MDAAFCMAERAGPVRSTFSYAKRGTRAALIR